MTYEPYSIIAVPFPFSDGPVTKKRPAVVISKIVHQKISDTITLLMITSAKHSKWESDHQIINLKAAGLTAPSVIRQKIFTIDIRLVLRIIGHLSKEDQKHLLQKLNDHIID